MRSRHLVEPEALEFIERLPTLNLSLENLAQLRISAKQATRAASAHSAPGVRTERFTAPGIQGGPDVSVTVYSPEASTSPRAALLHIHGGGYVNGDPEGEAEWSEWFVSELKCVVVAPDYRLAPEHTHPAQLMDCYSTLAWLHDRCDELNVDRDRIGIYGGSAGGGLAAAVALLARDSKEIRLRFQCLLYPMLDDRTAVDADPNVFAGEYVWTRSDNLFGWKSLLGHEPGRAGVSPYAAPARAENFAGLPPTFIWVGALDLFVDESIEYARRLVRAGVATELHVYPGVTHGNILVPGAPSSQVCRGEILRALKRAL